MRPGAGLGFCASVARYWCQVADSRSLEKGSRVDVRARVTSTVPACAPREWQSHVHVPGPHRTAYADASGCLDVGGAPLLDVCMLWLTVRMARGGGTTGHRRCEERGGLMAAGREARRRTVPQCCASKLTRAMGPMSSAPCCATHGRSGGCAGNSGCVRTGRWRRDVGRREAARRRGVRPALGQVPPDGSH